MQPIGQARTEIEIVDVSVLVNTGLKGIIGVCGVTERGTPNKPVLIGSWLEYQREFGGFVAGSNFPHLMKRAFEAGGRLKVSRAAHYSNTSDPNTIEGVKSDVSIAQGIIVAVAATFKITVITAGVVGNIISASINTGLGSVSLGSYTVQGADTISLVRTGLNTAINAGTGVHGYSSAISGSTITVTAPSALGALANSYIPSLNLTGTVNAYLTQSASRNLPVTVAGGAGDTITAFVNNGVGNVQIGTYVVILADTITLVADGLRASINANTGTTGYTATNVAGVITTVANPILGATANAYTTSVVLVGAVVGAWAGATLTGGVTSTTLENGVTAQTAYTLDVTAKSIGVWGDNLRFRIKTPANALANTFDYEISLVGYADLTETYKNLPAILTAPIVAEINDKSKLMDLSNFTGSVAAPSPSTYSLAGGSQIVANINTNDYIGSVAGETGIHSFDTDKEIVKIAVPDVAVPTLDIALAAYALMRKDLRAITRTPVGLDGQGIIAYREGTAPYSHAPVNTWFASMFTGGLKVTNPSTGLKEDISEIGDVLGAYSRKDNKSFEWFTVAGPKRGRIYNALGIVYDLGSPARQAIADSVDSHGVNAVINHESFGPVIWGNSTLQKEPTLLVHDNVADLLVAISRGLKPLIQSETFDPNDIETWKTIFRNVTPFMDYIKENRGVWNWLYQGDQDIDNISQAVVNTPANIDAGQYVFNLFISPKVGMKYQGVKVIVANSGVNFEELTQTL